MWWFYRSSSSAGLLPKNQKESKREINKLLRKIKEKRQRDKETETDNLFGKLYKKRQRDRETQI